MWFCIDCFEYLRSSLQPIRYKLIFDPSQFQRIYSPFGYLALVLSIIGRYVYKLEKDINEINRAAAELLIMEPKLPADIRPAEDTLRELRMSILRNEAAAREAEQKKNDLVVYLAHDLKTPLTSVIGYLTLLEESPDLPIKQRAKYTSITLEKAYRLEQLINEFFDITRFGLQSAVLEITELILP